MEIEIKPKRKKEKRIFRNILIALHSETEKPITIGELEERMNLSMKRENVDPNIVNPNLSKKYQPLYELLLGLATTKGLVRVEYFCGEECNYMATCPSNTIENACYLLTNKGIKYLKKIKAGHA